MNTHKRFYLLRAHKCRNHNDNYVKILLPSDNDYANVIVSAENKYAETKIYRS